MEENSDLKLQEMVRAKVKVMNLTRDSVLIDSEAMSMRLVHKMSTPMLQSALFVNNAEFAIFFNNVLSSSIGENGAEKVNI